MTDVPTGYQALTSPHALRQHLAHVTNPAPVMLCNNWTGAFRTDVDLAGLPRCQACQRIAALEIAATRRATDLEIDRSNCPIPVVGHRGVNGRMMRRCTCPDLPDLRRAYYRDRYHAVRQARGIPSAPNQWIPSSDVDPTAVERAIRWGELTRMTTAERTRTVAELTARGWSALRIASHLDMSARTVLRHRRRSENHATIGAFS